MVGPFRVGLKKKILDSYAKHSKRSSEDNITSNNLVDALVNIFTNYEFTDMNYIPPNELRLSLSQISDKFQIQNIADANEALETILFMLHNDTGMCIYSLKYFLYGNVRLSLSRMIWFDLP